MKPTVSVIMPVYNGGKFLSPAIASILDQTFVDFELIVIDDASTDASPDVCADFAARDDRIVFHRLATNSGAIGARNHAIRLARAEILVNMDADDVSVPDRIGRQLAQLRSDPAIGGLGSYVQLIDEHGQVGRVKRYPTEPAQVGWSLFFLNSVAHPTLMVRKAVLEAVGGYATERTGSWAEDYDLLTRINRIARIANCPEVLLLYRQTTASTTHRHWDRQEQSATDIVRVSVEGLIGPLLSPDIPSLLRGLAADRYPKKLEEFSVLGESLFSLCEAYIASRQLRPDEASAVRLDAGTKLWLLSALVSVRNPAIAGQLAWRAGKLSPGSAFAFARKAARKLLAR